MKKLSVPLTMKSISFALMVISLTLFSMPAAPLPAEHEIREETVFHTDEVQSMHSAVKQTAKAALTAQGEEGFPSGVYGDLGSSRPRSTR